MRSTHTRVAGLLLLEPPVFADMRGDVVETIRRDALANIGINFNVAQQTITRSQRNVLRGLIYQLDLPQARLIRVLQGEIFDINVDIRVGSPTFGEWYGIHLSSSDALQVFSPSGCAHGYSTLTEHSLVVVEYDQQYSGKTRRGLRWDDPDLAIPWPESRLTVSDQQQAFPFLRDVPAEDLPTYRQVRETVTAGSCFLSHATADLPFVKQLYDDLTRSGFNCWFAPESMRIGDGIRDTLEGALTESDRVVVVLSQSAIKSRWVEEELEAAFERERTKKKRIVFPLTLDSAAMSSRRAWTANLRRTRHIGDFTNWKDRYAYETAFAKLVSSLAPSHEQAG